MPPGDPLLWNLTLSVITRRYGHHLGDADTFSCPSFSKSDGFFGNSIGTLGREQVRITIDPTVCFLEQLLGSLHCLAQGQEPSYNHSPPVRRRKFG